MPHKDIKTNTILKEDCRFTNQIWCPDLRFTRQIILLNNWNRYSGMCYLFNLF